MWKCRSPAAGGARGGAGEAQGSRSTRGQVRRARASCGGELFRSLVGPTGAASPEPFLAGSDSVADLRLRDQPRGQAAAALVQAGDSESEVVLLAAALAAAVVMPPLSLPGQQQ